LAELAVEFVHDLSAPKMNPGSARASRAGDGALAIANFSRRSIKDGLGEGAETSTRWRVRSPEF
jgi:hypothetical protein